MKINLHPHWGPGRIVWAVWCALWVFLWFGVGMLTFWPALFTLMPGSAILGLLVLVEREPQQIPGWKRTQVQPNRAPEPQRGSEAPPPPPVVRRYH